MSPRSASFLIDECLSPTLVSYLTQRGYYAVHPLNVGLCGQRDDQILNYCLQQDLAVVTHNAGDFRRLVGSANPHPGLWIVERNSVAAARQDLAKLLAFAEQASGGDVRDWMFNRVLEVQNRIVRSYHLPPI